MQLSGDNLTTRSAWLKHPNALYKQFKGLSSSHFHNDSHLKFAPKHLAAGINWNDMVFSDKKKNLI